MRHDKRVTHVNQRVMKHHHLQPYKRRNDERIKVFNNADAGVHLSFAGSTKLRRVRCNECDSGKAHARLYCVRRLQNTHTEHAVVTLFAGDASLTHTANEASRKEGSPRESELHLDGSHIPFRERGARSYCSSAANLPRDPDVRVRTVSCVSRSTLPLLGETR